VSGFERWIVPPFKGFSQAFGVSLFPDSSLEKAGSSCFTPAKARMKFAQRTRINRYERQLAKTASSNCAARSCRDRPSAARSPKRVLLGEDAKLAGTSLATC